MMWEVAGGILIAAFLLAGIQPGPAQLPDVSGDIEDRRVFWNGYWGDRTKGEDVVNGEVHGWVHPRVTNPNPRDLEADPYPPGYDGEQPPPRRWYGSKNGLRR